MMKWVILLSLLTISIAVVPFAFAGDLIVFEDFEDYEAEEDPEGWDTDNTSFMDVVEDPVKNGEKSLKIHCPTDEQDVWIEFGREVQVVSVEFWIFPSTSSRTLSLLMLNGSVARENAGPYLGWGSCQAGFLCRYTGGAWGSTGIRFEDNEWTYVKVVADLTRSPKSYDVYLGEGPDKLPDEPQGKNIPYRSTAMSAFDRVLFLGWGDVAGPGYIDDFLVYEGTERPSGIFSISVEWMGKLATKWGAVRNR
jgi:hypothetical protein